MLCSFFNVFSGETRLGRAVLTKPVAQSPGWLEGFLAGFWFLATRLEPLQGYGSGESLLSSYPDIAPGP